MCGAATPDDGAFNVVIRLDRMRRVRDVSPLANTITVEAGCILADGAGGRHGGGPLFSVEPRGRGLMPDRRQYLDQCRRHGGAALRTDAGSGARAGSGAAGRTRSSTACAHCARTTRGYALKQLFIGAEGTLGIVTAAVLKLFAPPRSSALALLKLHDVEQALQIMQRLRGAVGDRLGSLEIMSRSQIEAIAATVPHVAIPFELTTPWYLIVELTDTLAGIDLNEPLAAVLSDAMDAGLAEDAVLASSLAQAKAIWAVRHSVSEGNKRSGYVVSHDSVVPLEHQAAFARQCRDQDHGGRSACAGGDAWPYRRWQYSRGRPDRPRSLPRS